MKVSLNDIRLIFENLLSNTISREDADKWACECIEATDNYSIEYIPLQDKLKIQEAIAFLSGIELKFSKDKYCYTSEEIRIIYEEKWKG